MKFMNRVSSFYQVMAAKLSPQEQAKRRQEQNKMVLKNMKNRSHQDDHDDDDEGGGFVPNHSKTEKIPGIKDLGEMDLNYERGHDPIDDIGYDFFEETEERHPMTSTDVKKLIAEYTLKRKPRNMDANHFKKYLQNVYDKGGVDTVEHIKVKFYLLPADKFGKADTGPSANLLDPDERDIDDKVESATLPVNVIVIYTDDEKKYEKMFKKLKLSYEKNNVYA